MFFQSGQRSAVRDQCFYQKSVPAAFILIEHCRTCDALRFCNATLLEKHTSASLINLGHQTSVFAACEDPASVIEVFVCFVTPVDPEIQHSKIVFDAGEITLMLCLFEVITCR